MNSMVVVSGLDNEGPRTPLLLSHRPIRRNQWLWYQLLLLSANLASPNTLKLSLCSQVFSVDALMVVRLSQTLAAFSHWTELYISLWFLFIHGTWASWRLALSIVEVTIKSNSVHYREHTFLFNRCTAFIPPFSGSTSTSDIFILPLRPRRRNKASMMNTMHIIKSSNPPITPPTIAPISLRLALRAPPRAMKGTIQNDGTSRAGHIVDMTEVKRLILRNIEAPARPCRILCPPHWDVIGRQNSRRGVYP